MTDFFSGLSYNARGLRFFLANRSLWKYAAIPLCLNLLLCALLIAVYVRYTGEVYAFLARPLENLDLADPQGVWQHVWDASLWVVRLLARVVIFAVTFLVILAAAYALSLMVNGPFYEMLSEKVLILIGRREDHPFRLAAFFGEMAHSLRIESVKAALFIVVTALFLAASWIPVVGIFATVTQFFFSTWFFAFGLCTYPLVLDRVPASRALKWGVARKMLLVGFGLPALVPLLGVLLMNVQVVGGTLLYADHA